MRVAMGLLLAAGIPALLAAWIWLFPDRRPAPLLVVAASQYAAPAPPNDFAAENARNFQSAFGDYDNIRLTRTEDPQDSAQLLASLEGYFEQTAPGGPDENIVLVYVSVHGVVNDRGEPCLLLPAHDPLDATAWLPVSELLAAIDAAAKSKNCVAVVMLDAHRIRQAWRMGVVTNTFGLALEALLAESPPRYCRLLAAATGLQQAAAAPELSATPFAYYLTRGLRGEADRQGDADDVVSLDELAKYVSGQTNAWTARRRGQQQQPQVLGDVESDLKLADVAGTAELPAQAWAPAIDRAAFKDLYGRIGALERASLFERRPGEWAKITYLLDRLNAEAIAGSAYARMATASTLPELQATLTAAETSEPWPYDVHAASLAIHDRLQGEPPQEAIRDQWTGWLQDAAAAPPPSDFPAAAAFTWGELTAGAAGVAREELSKRLEFCRLARQGSDADFTELALLRLLAAGVDWDSPVLAGGAPRQLLAARRESESLAAPADPRVHYAIGKPLRSLDAEWNAALDDVLVGSDESLHRAQERLTALYSSSDNGYGPLQARSELVLRAFRARDQALAVALELTQLSVGRAQWDAQQRIDQQRLTALVARALELSTLLDETCATDSEAYTSPTNRLTSQVDELEQDVSDQLAVHAEMVAAMAVEEAGSTLETAMETPSLLRCMAGFSDAKTRLHELWMARLADAGLEIATAPVSPTAAAGKDLEYLRWCAEQGVAPLRRFLVDDSFGLSSAQEQALATPVMDDETSPRDVLRSVADFERALRQAIRDLPAACQRRLDNSRATLASAPARQARLGFSQADVATRFFAPIAGARLRFAPQETPSELLHKLDVQAWLAWEGERVVDDCWGRLAANEDETPHFTRVVERLAEEVERIDPEATYDVAQLRARMQVALDLVEGWKPLSTVDMYVSDDGGGLASHQVALDGRQDLVSGTAAVYLTDSEGRLVKAYTPASLEVRRGAFDIRQGAELSTQLRTEEIRDIPLLYANVLFRGHVRQEVFRIGHGVVVEWQRPPATEASVVVRGDSKLVSQIVLVVDCSSSMREKTRNKLQQGVEKLQLIIDELVKRDQRFRIAVLFYGRRVGWESASSNKPKPNPNAPWNGLPGNDVEPILPLTLLDKNVSRNVKALLAKAEPWGETPLYLALVRALDLFDYDAPGPCHLIAVTDGINDVASGQPLGEGERKTHRDVITALGLRKPRVKLDIVEFGGKLAYANDAERLKWEKGRREIEDIVGSAVPRGSLRMVSDADALIKELEDSLQLDRYAVRPAGRASSASGPESWRELGQATPLGPLTEKQRFDVVLQGHSDATASVELEGGEAVELVYRRSPENRLLFPIYESEDQKGPAQSVAGAMVASHTPKWPLPDPVFRASIQSGDERRFSSRPALIWAKIQPVDQGDMRNYYFFDPEFERGLPVPMLNLRTRGWTNARFARVELCFAMDETAIDAPWTAIPRAGSTALDLHGASLQIRSEIAGAGVQVVVEEQHASDDANYPLNVQLDPPAHSISRTYFDSKNLARHVFQYATQPPNPRIRAITRRQIEAAGGTAVFERVELPRR